MRCSGVLACALFVGACGAPTGNGAIVAPTRSTAATTTSGGPTTAPSATITSPLPPSGRWDLEVRVVRDTCSPKIAQGLTQSDLLLLSHRTKAGRIVLNVPLIAAKGTVVARSDVFAEPGWSTSAKTQPDPLCPSYEVDRATTVTSVAHDRIVVHRLTKYGDRALCPPQPPSICETDLEYTYALTHAECELPCTGQIDPNGSSDAKLKCVCP